MPLVYTIKNSNGDNRFGAPEIRYIAKYLQNQVVENAGKVSTSANKPIQDIKLLAVTFYSYIKNLSG